MGGRDKEKEISKKERNSGKGKIESGKCRREILGGGCV
jgi:hypothetical protein